MHKIRTGRTAGPVLMVITVIFALAAAVLAGDQVPFKGHAVDMITGSHEEADGLHFTNAAWGQATHLGQFTRVGSGVIFGDGTFEGPLVFTAANGDQLFANAEGALTSPTTAAGTYTFTGGTGRFRNASGEAAFVGVMSDGIQFDVEFSGTISSPGASKK